jgi:TonB family protein
MMPVRDWEEQGTGHLKSIGRGVRRWFNDDPTGSTAGALPLVFLPEKRGATPPIHAAGGAASGLGAKPSPSSTVFNLISAADGVLIVLVVIAAWYINRLPDDSGASGQPEVVSTISAEQQLPDSVVTDQWDATSDAQTASSVPSREAPVEMNSTALRYDAALSYDAAVVLKQVKPMYPPAARRSGIEGMVVVTYSISANGRPTDLKVTKSIPGLDEAALAALRQWEYTKPPPGSTQRYRFNAEFVLD